MNQFHTPVLVDEVVEYLNIKPGKKYIDATVGGGGHAGEIIKHGGQVLGIDHDPEALVVAQKKLEVACSVLQPRLKPFDPQPFKLIKGNFKDIQTIAQNQNFAPVAGILFDLGASNYQLTHPTRGFSFYHDAPLDMRMDPDLAVTAKDLVNALSQKELYELFTKYSQEHRARAIAAAIVRARRQKPIVTTLELARLVEQVYGGRRFFSPRKRLHPATKVFQALRIAVNDELNNLKAVLPQAIDLLEPEGRIVVISFHEGEDHIVKHYFKDLEAQNLIHILTQKHITATQNEIQTNPNSRSAKLRAAQKIESRFVEISNGKWKLENRSQFPVTNF